MTQIPESVPDFEKFVCGSRELEKYHCEFCRFSTDLRVILRKHCLTFHRQTICILGNILKDYTCKKCDYQTYSLLFWIRHDCRFKKNKPRNRRSTGLFRCFYCFSYTSNLKTDLEAHFSQNHSFPDFFGWFNCAYCDYKSRSVSTIETHIIMRHISFRNRDHILCPFCPLSDPSKIVLKEHIAEKHDLKHIKWYDCEQCPYNTNQIYNLRRHTLAQHSDSVDESEWVNCEYCSFKLMKNHGDLAKHILANHTPKQIKWQQCDFCSFRAKRKYNLKVHMRTHGIGDKDGNIVWFQCEKCPHKTKRKGDLKRHMLSLHPQPGDVSIMPWFFCDQCPYKSNRKCNLQRHTLSMHKV